MKYIFLIICLFSTIIANDTPYTNEDDSFQNEPQYIPIYDFSLKLLNDTSDVEVKLSDFKGDVVLLNFWATWCVPCKKELPDLSLLKSRIKKYNLDVLTISIDKKNIKDQLKFLSNNGASNLDHFFDREMKIFKALKLRGVPTTIIVDQNSYVISKHEGILKWGEDEIINKIKNLFY